MRLLWQPALEAGVGPIGYTRILQCIHDIVLPFPTVAIEEDTPNMPSGPCHRHHRGESTCHKLTMHCTPPGRKGFVHVFALSSGVVV